MRGTLALCALAWFAACTAPQPDIRSTITPQAIAASTEPLLFVELSDSGAQAIMSLTGRNGDVVTWSTTDGRSISLEAGVLVATRGLGFDLMSADATGTLAALEGQNTEYNRFLTYLDGDNSTVYRSLACRMSEPRAVLIDNFGQVVEMYQSIETCASTIGEIQSQFWLVNGEIRRAIQNFGAPLLEITTERLIAQ